MDRGKNVKRILEKERERDFLECGRNCLELLKKFLWWSFIIFKVIWRRFFS